MSIFQGIRSKIFRFLFHLLYHQFAWTYDWVAAFVSVGMWKDWVLSVLPYTKGHHVLEIGFGPGHLQFSLREKGFKSVGIDLSKQMVHITRNRLMKSGYEPDIINGSAWNLPLSNQSFDTVVATFPSEYIFKSTILLEIRRILRPGGKLVVLPAAWITGDKWIHRLAAWLFQITGQSPKFDDSLYNYLKTPFVSAGFDVELRKETVRSSFVIIVLAKMSEVY